jgi:HEXXH motif-containing protein
LRAAVDNLLRYYKGHSGEVADPEHWEFFSYYSQHPTTFIDDLLGSDEPHVVFSVREVPRRIRIWRHDAARSPRDRAFAALLLRHHVPGVRDCDREAQTSQTLKRATALLLALLPDLAASTVPHLDFVVVGDFDDEVGSATISRIPGTVFLSRASLASAWTAAEAILHECTHLKFVELEHTHTMLMRGYREDESPRIHPPWHPLAVTWPLNRALTAAQVYVVLTFYSWVAQAASFDFRDAFGPFQHSRLLKESHTALERACRLLDLLDREAVNLGPAGRAFLDWMHEVVEKILVASKVTYGTW